jgi:hypothetical protein
LNIEDVALHIALILRHCLPSLNHVKGVISSTVPKGRRFARRINLISNWYFES